MPSIKIINVLRTDKFEDVLAVFKKTESKDVIFVLPKKSKVFSQDDHFAEMAVESKALDKNVSILSQNPEINRLAGIYKFTILNAKSGQAARTAEPVVQLAKSSAAPDYHDETDDEMNTSDYRTFHKDDEEDEPGPKTFSNEDLEETGDDEKEEPIPEDETETEKGELDEEVLDEVGEEVGDEIGDGDETENISAPNEGVVASLIINKNPVVEDIVPPKRNTSVKIEHQSEQKAKIEIQEETSEMSPFTPKPDADKGGTMDKIKEVWKSKNGGIWDNVLIKKGGERSNRPGVNFWKFDSEKSPRRLVIVLVVCAILVFGSAIYMTTGKAEIIIKPRSNNLNVTLNGSASDKYVDVNLEKNEVPGQLFSINKTVEETFSPTGERDVAQKARGTITIYNEYSTNPQTLVATTRFESENGLVFRTLTSVSVPGMKVTNGTTTPGSINVDVIADKAGGEYNIEAGKFGVVAFKERSDTAHYQKLYAKSTKAMSGGIVGKAKVVTQIDINSAKESVNQKVIDATKNELQQKMSSLKLLSTPLPIIEESVASAKVDEAVDTFTVSATATVEVVAIDEADIHKLLNAYLDKNGGLMTMPEKVDLAYSNSTLANDTKVLNFSVTAKGTAYYPIDNDGIRGNLAGKKEKDIVEYLKSVENVSSARVILKPFWVKKIPQEPSRTTISIDYN